jgi:ribosomal-protein-alanine N-acetyltransferase
MVARMALLDWMSSEAPLSLDGDGVRLRPPRSTDFAAWSELRELSRGFLQPWEPTWAADDLGRPAFRRRLAAYARDLENGTGYAFLVFRSEDDRLVGGVTLSNVRRGVAQACSLGYWVGRPYARRGHTCAAVRAAARFAFDGLGLHRIEAACVPENRPSRNLLLKCGFECEGRARAYLKINGVWADHLLFGLVRDER